MEKQIMLGNEAFARGAYEAGVHVISSYPGTPSTEITEAAAKYDEMHVEWSTNEKVGVEVAAGASVAGARSLSCMKHVGLNVAADPLFTAAYTGVNGGMVLVVADDNGCHSSQNEQDTRYYARSAGVPCLEPASAPECKDFMKLAYELSEQYDEPVIIRSNTRISHSRGIVELLPRQEAALRPYEKNIQKYIPMPAMAKKLHVENEKRMNALEEAANTLKINRVEMNSKKIGVIAAGICYQYAKEALPEASFLKLGLVNPLPKKLIADFAAQVDELYVIEEGQPIFEEQINAMGIETKGKALFTIQGEYSVNMIKKALLGEDVDVVQTLDAPGRPPLFCAGCPHRAVFYVLGKLKKVVTGDIGCYTLGALAPLSAMDTTLCMGGSITMAHGMEMARGSEYAKNVVAVIGDSTFFHSGITGLINMKYNGATGTVVILDNRITGMTGHQDNPCTGKNAKGEPAYAVDIEALVKACGVEHVVTVDPFDLKAFEQAVKEETARGELSVIVARRPCALIVKQLDMPLRVNDNCKNCGMCMKIGCPAIEKADGKAVIVAERCNGCGLCTKVCKFGAIEEA
ncbi:MAG: indolepyruvate ferredoxin oxidoreductase subunit alpha [Clostridiales bacterium]|nr:MAG: indolepyruvate ferredoxin oxidoreductase subunit alpha [Clostridiales bacterium]